MPQSSNNVRPLRLATSLNRHAARGTIRPAADPTPRSARCFPLCCCSFQLLTQTTLARARAVVVTRTQRFEIEVINHAGKTGRTLVGQHMLPKACPWRAWHVQRPRHMSTEEQPSELQALMRNPYAVFL